MNEDRTEKTVAFYEGEATEYDCRRWSTLAGKYINDVQIGIVEEMLPDMAGLKAIDVATGTGRFAFCLAARGANIVAIDTSQAMLDACKDKFERGGKSESLQQLLCSATNVPLPDGSFQVATCINALNHIPNPGKVVAELGRLTAAEGIVITSYTNWVSIYWPAGVLVNLRKKALLRNVYTKWFSWNEISEMHVHAGLKIEKVVGATQFPASITAKPLLAAFMAVDKGLRSSVLRWIAPNLFVMSRRM